MSHDSDHPLDIHGKSVAGWTGVSILLLAAVLIAAGVAWGVHALQIAGVVVAVIGVAAGVILSKVGFGAPPIPPPPYDRSSAARLIDDPSASQTHGTGR